MKRQRRAQGFTLAELLIVVAVIAVLVAIAIPVYSAQMNKAGLAVDAANERIMQSYIGILKNEGELQSGDAEIRLDMPITNFAMYCLMKDGTLHTILGPGVSVGLPTYPAEGAYLAQGNEAGDSTHKKGAYLVRTLRQNPKDPTLVWITPPASSIK